MERTWKDLGRRSNGNSKFSTFLKAALDKGHRNSKLICRKLFNKAISANTSRVVSFTNKYVLSHQNLKTKTNSPKTQKAKSCFERKKNDSNTS